MLLAKIMSVWELVVVVLVVCCIVVIVRPRGVRRRPLLKHLFDFSGGREEGLRVQRLLVEALAGSQTDAEFEGNYKRLTEASTGVKAENDWGWLCFQLLKYRRAGEWEESSLILARRYQADIARLYGLKAPSE